MRAMSEPTTRNAVSALVDLNVRSPYSHRYTSSQNRRTLNHPSLPQPTEHDEEWFKIHPPWCAETKFSVAKSKDEDALSSPDIDESEIFMRQDSHTFVVCADSQIGMTSQNKEWETELEYCRHAIQKINIMDPPPLFVTMCGDLVDMEYSFFASDSLSKEKCDEIQDHQNEAFKKTWSTLDDRIALVCICGNHDVGNHPTPASIEKFRNAFGDEYLAFWANGSYNIVLNNVLFADPSNAMTMYNEQLKWLEGRLQYASALRANQIFIFAHHPWFLYNDDEDPKTLTGESAFPGEWGKSDRVFSDSYFSMNVKYRNIALSLFKKYNVNASFAGHFHQNLVSKASFGMDMIITAPLSMVFESTGKPKDQLELEPNGRGIRVVDVHKGGFHHGFELL